MSKKLTSEDKVKFIKASLTQLTDEQKKIISNTSNVDAQYTKVQRYKRILKEGQRKENHYLLGLANKYRNILEGLECVDEKRWTNEKKIKAFSDLLDTYADKCVKLVEDNNRKHLERLMLQRDQLKKNYEDEQAKLDKEIAIFEDLLK
jgi:hypothetical protein